MWQRFLFWMKKGKDCRKCCMHCKYYQQCRQDVLSDKG